MSWREVKTRRENRSPDDAAAKRALNRKVQGGDTSGFSGFPSGGHAHQTQRGIAGYTFIGSRTLSAGKHPRAAFSITLSEAFFPIKNLSKRVERL